MLEDIAYKLVRKFLPKDFYSGFSGWLNRKGLRPESYEQVFAHYQEQKILSGRKTVLELGCGNQFITALFFLRGGAERVILVDPKIDMSRFEEHAEAFRIFTGSATDPGYKERIFCFHGLEELPPSYESGVDLICSHLVLEHVADLEGCFVHHARLLSASGQAYHLVDLSDHTYHVFGKFHLTRSLLDARILHHLRYSNAFYKRLNDPRTFVNRILLPQYLDFARRNKLRILSLNTHPHREAPIHTDLLKQLPEHNPQDRYISGFSISLARIASEPASTSPART